MTDHIQYEEALEKELLQITHDLKELGIHNPEVPEDWIATPGEVVDSEPDENIAADRSEDWQERRATLSALETRFNNINRALLKIEGGKYGICEICGDAIEEDRLRANPAARTNKEHINDETNLPA
ncbi:MAG: RNA polymerase-binding transcription factor DksA [Acidimicrobiales bacterium]|jgi:RNA polymerase-binding transcription factor DksA